MRGRSLYIAVAVLFAVLLFPDRASAQFREEAFQQNYNEPGDTTGRDSTDTAFSFKEYFGGLNYFFAAEQADLTFEDVIAHIGVDPSQYCYDAGRDAQIYSWYAAESKARVLHVWFKNGKLYACGAYNLGFPKMS